MTTIEILTLIQTVCFIGIVILVAPILYYQYKIKKLDKKWKEKRKEIDKLFSTHYDTNIIK